MSPLLTLEATIHTSLLRTRSVAGVTKDLLILKLLDIQVATCGQYCLSHWTIGLAAACFLWGMW